MPIEIKELFIKAIVVERNREKNPQVNNKMDREKLKNDLLKDCVNEVLQILEDKRER